MQVQAVCVGHQDRAVRNAHQGRLWNFLAQMFRLMYQLLTSVTCAPRGAATAELTSADADYAGLATNNGRRPHSRGMVSANVSISNLLLQRRKGAQKVVC